MYIEPEIKIIRFEGNEITTLGVSDGNAPGTGPDIGYDDI